MRHWLHRSTVMEFTQVMVVGSVHHPVEFSDIRT